MHGLFTPDWSDETDSWSDISERYAGERIPPDWGDDDYVDADEAPEPYVPMFPEFADVVPDCPF